jgi:hypothetical protein
MHRLSVGTAALAVAFLAPSQTPPNPPPATMTKIVVRLIGPTVKPGSHAALPKTIYKAGPHYARIEDPPDAKQQQQKLTIIAEPDAYSVNLIDKRGTHAIDQGGAPGDLHLPIVLPFDPNHKLPDLDKLEFGSEYEFFLASGATNVPGPIVNGESADAYQLKMDGAEATLVVRRGSQIPITLSWTADHNTYKYEYIIDKEMPFD